MKTNFNSLLDQLDNGLSSNSFTFGIIIIIMSGVAMLSNIIVLIVINKFKKINSKEDKGKDKDKSEEQELQKLPQSSQDIDKIIGPEDVTIKV